MSVKKAEPKVEPAASIDFKPNRYFLEMIVGAGFSRRKSRQIYNALLKHITKALMAGEVVQLKGFGSFQARPRKVPAKPGEPPGEGATRQVARFRPAHALKLLAQQLTHNEPEQPSPLLPPSPS